MNKKQVDLYALYCEVQKNEGFKSALEGGHIGQICEKLGFISSNSKSNVGCELEAIYKRFLLRFEELGFVALPSRTDHEAFGVVKFSGYDLNVIDLSKFGPSESEENETSVKIKKTHRKVIKPKNGYLTWSDVHRKTVRDENPGATLQEVSKIMGELWNAKDPEEKEDWKRKGQEIFDARLQEDPQLAADYETYLNRDRNNVKVNKLKAGRKRKSTSARINMKSLHMCQRRDARSACQAPRFELRSSVEREQGLASYNWHRYCSRRRLVQFDYQIRKIMRLSNQMKM